MTLPTRIAQLGAVMQLAFVPADFDATLRFWIETMGAGPFYILSGYDPDWTRYRGALTRPDLEIALGHWGDMQIEIIRQRNDAPSIYKEWRDRGGEGLHHTCIVVEDLEQAKRVCAEAAAETILGGAGNGAEWFYVDTGGGPGTIVEIIRHSAITAGLMKMIRDAAVDWDGTDPIRRNERPR